MRGYYEIVITRSENEKGRGRGHPLKAPRSYMQILQGLVSTENALGYKFPIAKHVHMGRGDTVA